MSGSDDGLIDGLEASYALRTSFMVTGRQQGKTEALIRWVNEAPEARVALVCNTSMVRHMIERGCPEHRVFTVDEFRRGHRLQGIARRASLEVGVDDVELVLRDLFGDVRFVTASGSRT